MNWEVEVIRNKEDLIRDTQKFFVGVLCHVDVVPPGDGWTSDPFSAEIRNGRIYARGAIDDKGPTMAAFYALKIVKDMQLPLSKRVRIIYRSTA
ncbi:hypothetical protein CS954_15585 [Bacillus siamensis]|nr:hypothetical protein CS954_15585 [Bacillus siamensis]